METYVSLNFLLTFIFLLLSTTTNPIPALYMSFEYDDSPLHPEDGIFYYDDEEEEEEGGNMYDNLNLSGSFSFHDILENCIEPTVTDGIKHVGKLIIWCIVFRITTQMVKGPSWFKHVSSIICGLFVLSHFFYKNIFYILSLSTLSYAALYSSDRFFKIYRGPLTAFTCLSFNLACEFFVASSIDWHQIRGAQMILTMKAISLGFDLDKEDKVITEPVPIVDQKRGVSNGSRKKRHQTSTTPKVESNMKRIEGVPSLLQFSGYTLNPGTCVFGPWVKFEDYLNIYEDPKWNVSWLIKMIFSTVFGFMFLTISTCWNPWLIPDNNWKWWTAYRDAMSFRASHYFVSYISETTAVAAGFGSTLDGQWSAIYVSQPHNVEVPRSLVDVVVSWNVPMHTWLKTYCFKVVLSCYGQVAAIVATYVVSTLLHGLNFQLGAVLLSLGFYTYTEYRLRKKLAVTLDASIEARKERKYSHKEGEVPVMVVNLLFGLIAYFHLAYLGVMFDHSNDLMQMEGYSWRHALNKWERLGFLSHWVMFFTFAISLLI